MRSHRKKSELSLVWDDIWKAPHGYSKERLARTQEKINNLIKMGLCFDAGQKILDGGCGNGINLILLERMFQVSPFGIDISREALSAAEKNIVDSESKAILKQGDVRDIPFDKNEFDVVMSWGVIEHFPDYELAIEEFWRVLRPGGTLNLVQPNKFSLRHLKKISLEMIGRWPFGMQINFSPSFLCSLLRKKGFRNIRFSVRPYSGSGGIINLADAWLNKVNKNCGYYLYILAEK